METAIGQVRASGSNVKVRCCEIGHFPIAANHGNYVSDGSYRCEAHLYSKLGNLICLMHIFTLTIASNIKFEFFLQWYLEMVA